MESMLSVFVGDVQSAERMYPRLYPLASCGQSIVSLLTRYIGSGERHSKRKNVSDPARQKRSIKKTATHASTVSSTFRKPCKTSITCAINGSSITMHALTYP